MILDQHNTQNVSYLSLLYSVSLNFKDKIDFNEAYENLKSIWKHHLLMDDLAFYIYNKDNQTFKPYQSYCSLSSKNHLAEFSLNKQLLQTLKINKEDKVFIGTQLIEISSLIEEPMEVDTTELNLYLPLVQSDHLLGILVLVNPKVFNRVLNYQNLMLLAIVANQFSQAYVNQDLRLKISVDARISNATKDVAKIIESQYEWKYVIPIMGEIMDKYLSSALIYIFLRDQEGNFKLAWPTSYCHNTVDPLLNTMAERLVPVESESGFALALPLIAQGALIGAVVGDAKIEQVNNVEAYFLKELAKQCSITLSRAMTYAETVKHATVDALTGLDNRRQLDKRLLQEASVVVRTKRPLSILMMDIDFFKKINDSHGHSVGDFVLKEVAKIIKEQCREYDITARYGGEEFVVLCPDTSKEGAFTLAERIRQNVESYNFNIGKYVSSKAENIKVTVSIGITTFLSSLKNPADLYEEADIALYDAKKSGRNQVKDFNA